MKKELTPLEHLEFIRNYEIDDEHRTLNMNYASKQSLDIIETALKEYEGAKKHIEALNKERIENSIKIKALDVIKEKRVQFSLLYKSETVEEYNDWLWAIIGYKVYPLTQEEYDLLKRVLLCQQ